MKKPKKSPPGGTTSGRSFVHRDAKRPACSSPSPRAANNERAEIKKPRIYAAFLLSFIQGRCPRLNLERHRTHLSEELSLQEQAAQLLFCVLLSGKNLRERAREGKLHAVHLRPRHQLSDDLRAFGFHRGLAHRLLTVLGPHQLQAKTVVRLSALQSVDET